MVDSQNTDMRRAVVQKLESLRRAGVQCVPRSAYVASASQVTTPTSQNANVAERPLTESPRQPVSSPTAKRDDDSAIAAGKPATTSAATTSDPKSALPSKPQPSVSTPRPAVIGLPNALASAERPEALRILSDEVAACTKCQSLVGSRTRTVFGVGNPDARLVFFGEAPGADEDRLGEPFVGKAGQLLTKIIEACTLTRDDVYIMNVVKCRPPANRNPTPDEANNCRSFFQRQLEIIRPEFICCLGAIATSTLLDTTLSVGRLRGKFHDWNGVKVMVTYHPAYLLRNADAKKLVWSDMKMLISEMGIQLPKKG